MLCCACKSVHATISVAVIGTRKPHRLPALFPLFLAPARALSHQEPNPATCGTQNSSFSILLKTVAAGSFVGAAFIAGHTAGASCDEVKSPQEVNNVGGGAPVTAPYTVPFASNYHDRVDTKLHRAYPEFLQFHLIHETLRGKEKIEGYEVYKDRRDDSIVALARLGKLLSGHPDIIHGGSIAALLDNTMGVAFFAANKGNGFTANLTINYKRPIICGTEVKVLARVERIEGRKVFLRAEIRDAKDEAVLYTEATSLFITSQSPLLTGPKKVDIS